jgi:MFS transporter, OFA family, oxalate/formate antiporter
MFSTSFPQLVTFAVIYGVIYGGWVAVLPTVAADLFGEQNISSVIGALYTSVAIGSLIGPSAAGFMLDVSKDYRLPLTVGTGANLAAALIVAATRIRTGR